jgi:hypothetical protein
MIFSHGFLNIDDFRPRSIDAGDGERTPSQLGANINLRCGTDPVGTETVRTLGLIIGKAKQQVLGELRGSKQQGI